MRLYYQVYADDLNPALTFKDIFNRLWAAGGRFETVIITSKQMRLILDDSEVPSKCTEIKLGLTGFSHRPSFIQVSATTQERAAEVFRRLIQDDDSEEGINVYGSEEVGD